jgi:hypothetical protein
MARLQPIGTVFLTAVSLVALCPRGRTVEGDKGECFSASASGTFSTSLCDVPCNPQTQTCPGYEGDITWTAGECRTPPLPACSTFPIYVPTHQLLLCFCNVQIENCQVLSNTRSNYQWINDCSNS